MFEAGPEHLKEYVVLINTSQTLFAALLCFALLCSALLLLCSAALCGCCCACAAAGISLL